MTYRVQILRFAFAITVLAGCIPCRAQVVSNPYRKWLDCDVDWIFTESIVGSDFPMKVNFHGTPLARIKISLRQSVNGDKVAATAETDSHGIVHFHAISPGSYDAGISKGILFSSPSIEVKANHASGQKIEVNWPSRSIAVRTVRGRFNLAEELDSSEIPLRGREVQLLDLQTAQVIESTQTDANGDYEFATKAPGVYALGLTLPKKGGDGSDSHYLAVEVNDSANDLAVPEMTVKQSDCMGLQLLRRSPADDTWEEQ